MELMRRQVERRESDSGKIDLVLMADDEVTGKETNRSSLGRLWAILGIVVAGLYLLNPTAGILELLPDNLPVVGNLDEGAAAALLIYCLQYLRRSRDREDVT